MNSINVFGKFLPSRRNTHTSCLQPFQIIVRANDAKISLHKLCAVPLEVIVTLVQKFIAIFERNLCQSKKKVPKPTISINHTNTDNCRM
jgi:hypothetical protein